MIFPLDVNHFYPSVHRSATTLPLLPSCPSLDGTATTWLRPPPTWAGTRCVWCINDKPLFCDDLLNRTESWLLMKTIVFWQIRFSCPIDVREIWNVMLTKCCSGLERWEEGRQGQRQDSPWGSRLHHSTQQARGAWVRYCHLQQWVSLKCLMLNLFIQDRDQPCHQWRVRDIQIYTLDKIWSNKTHIKCSLHYLVLSYRCFLKSILNLIWL